MKTQIFINLPVKDLEKSKAFFRKLGYTFNEQYTDDTAACLVISDTIYAMLITHKKFREFTPKDIADATKTSEVLIALSVESKAAVHKMVDTALEAGGTYLREPDDYGFMFSRSFNDLDGHIWEVLWMNTEGSAQ